MYYHFWGGEYSYLIPELMANGLALMSVPREGQQDQTCTITSIIYKIGFFSMSWVDVSHLLAGIC